MAESFRYRGYLETEEPRGQIAKSEPAVTVGQWSAGRGVGKDLVTSPGN